MAGGDVYPTEGEMEEQISPEDNHEIIEEEELVYSQPIKFY
jgi:hypothetical protein